MGVQNQPAPRTPDDAIEALLAFAAAYRAAWERLRLNEAARALAQERDYPAYNYFATSGYEAMKAADRLARVLRQSQAETPMEKEHHGNS